MNDEKNFENSNQIDELVDRAMEDVNNNSVDEESNVDVQLGDNTQEDDNNFNGVFHERDSLSENNIVDEVEKSFLDYSMSVITSRAIPDLRDGLKPVHRRILWSMFNSGYTPDKPHRKSARLLVKLWVIIIHMEIVQFMKQWLEWLKILIKDICLLMVMVILVI